MMISILKGLNILSLAIMFILPIVLLYKQQITQTERLPTWLIFIIGSVLVWVFVQIGVYFTDTYLQAELNTFDLDNNDLFSRDEITEAQTEASHRVISDTGRTLAPITGVIFGFGYMSLLVIFFRFVRMIKEAFFHPSTK